MGEAVQPNELEAQLSEMRAKSASQIPEEAMAVMMKTIQDLAASGIAEKFLQEGAQAPGFSLPNVRGEQVKLSDFLARGPVVLAFYRGGWWPYCNLQLRVYQQHLSAIQALGAQLIAVSPMRPDSSLSFSEKLELKFEVLSDAGNKTAREYGLVWTLPEPLREVYTQFGLDIPGDNGDGSWELPVPGTYVIAQDGKVKLAFADTNHTHRLEPAAILDALKGLS